MPFFYERNPREDTRRVASNSQQPQNLTDTIYQLYDTCLELGMKPHEFWDLTHYDIVAYCNACNHKAKDDLMMMASVLYRVAQCEASFQGKQHQHISIKKAFPLLFDTPITSVTLEKQMRAFARSHNQRSKQKHDN